MRRRRERDERMPPTGAGLIRYFQEETGGPKVSPKMVMALAIGIIVFEILLRFYGYSLLGF